MGVSRGAAAGGMSGVGWETEGGGARGSRGRTPGGRRVRGSGQASGKSGVGRRSSKRDPSGARPGVAPVALGAASVSPAGVGAAEHQGGGDVRGNGEPGASRRRLCRASPCTCAS